MKATLRNLTNRRIKAITKWKIKKWKRGRICAETHD